MTTETVSLSPAEALLQRQISYWIGVSEAGKGGSKDNLGRGWTYLSAEDLQGRVADYENVHLSIPTIYRALRSLVNKGWLLREKLTSHRWYQVYHYTFGTNHPSSSKESNGPDQSDQLDPIKGNRSQLSIPSDSSTSKSIKQDSRPKPGTQQQNSIDKERPEFVPAPKGWIDMYTSGETTEVAEPEQPLTSIQGAASPELMDELREIETNYRSRLEELKTAEAVAEATGGRLERGIHNPSLERETPKVGTSRAPLPQSGPLTETPKGDIWKRIRELTGLYDASKVEPVSPKAVITKNGQRLRVDDGITSPLR